MKLDTRAMNVAFEAGLDERCKHCDTAIRWKAKMKNRRVVCNVYGGKPRRWLRVETYHEACYADAGQPYGEPTLKANKAFR